MLGGFDIRTHSKPIVTGLCHVIVRVFTAVHRCDVMPSMHAVHLGSFCLDVRHILVRQQWAPYIISSHRGQGRGSGQGVRAMRQPNWSVHHAQLLNLEAGLSQMYRKTTRTYRIQIQ